MLELNKIHQGDCLELMKKIPNNIIDLTITSPPYDNLRKYNGFSFDFKNIAKELFRITKEGGVVVWVVGDKRKNGSRTLTHFKQSLYFEEIGFNIHDLMIWKKPNPMPFIQKDQYTPSWELMIILSKGKPKTFNPILEKCKYAGVVLKTHTNNPESIRKANTEAKTKDFKIKSNVWDYIVAGKNYGHPAIFPKQLAIDNIISWSNEKDLILDPLCGSGTSCIVAKELNRKFIGIDISSEYCKIAKKRLDNHGG